MDFYGLGVIVVNQLNTATIEHYFHLSDTISANCKLLEQTRGEFYQQSFYSSPFAYEDDGQTPIKKVTVERAVLDLLACEDVMNEAITINQYRQQQFTRYLATLRPNQLAFLKRKYLFMTSAESNSQVEAQTVAEIEQIEDAVIYRFNLGTPEQRTNTTIADSLTDKMSAFFEIYGDEL